jgi:hypothetical protein
MKKHRALHWALAALCAAMFSPLQDGRADPDEENPYTDQGSELYLL